MYVNICTATLVGTLMNSFDYQTKYFFHICSTCFVRKYGIIKIMITISSSSDTTRNENKTIQQWNRLWRPQYILSIKNQNQYLLEDDLRTLAPEPGISGSDKYSVGYNCLSLHAVPASGIKGSIQMTTLTHRGQVTEICVCKLSFHWLIAN